MSANTRFDTIPVDFQPDDSEPLCRIMIIYQDQEAILRARELNQHLTQALEGEIDLACNYWRAEIVPLAWSNGLIEEAEDVDLILFSGDAEWQFRPALDEWLDTWLGGRSLRAGALAALVAASGARRSGPWQEHLERTAERFGLEYFAEFIAPQGDSPAKQNRSRTRNAIHGQPAL